MDALIAAGGEGYQLAIPEQPSWDAGLGVIRPHVHAKVMSVDGRICSVGSANLDITAGYWENELVLLVDDPSVAGALEGRIDALLLQSERVDRDNPAWKQTARRRQWMRRWPGMLSI
jgi:phosphatidylserine/phosphatidylglycerophosphate/cardiolipin synthase-like enzyme